MREQKIILGQMRESGVRGLLVYCADYQCSHLATRPNFAPARMGSNAWQFANPLISAQIDI